MSESEDVKLVRQCLTGDVNAFEVLVDKYHKAIFNVAFRIVRGYEDAQDITQIVFVKAFENLSNYKPEFKFFSWIYKMVTNESINFIKRKNRFDALEDDIVSREVNQEQRFHEAEIGEQIQDALMELQFDHRVIIILKHFEDCSYSDIGYILNLPEKTVKSRLFTARQNLRNILIKQGLRNSD